MMWFWRFGLLCLALVLGLAVKIHAQRPPITNIPRPSGPAQAPQQQRKPEVPDTVGLHAFLAIAPGQQTPFADSLLGNDFHQYDPARKREWDFISTGNAGGATRPFVYTPVYRKGIDIGFHQFDIYYTPAAALPFYRLQKPYTNLAYYQQGEQADSYFTAQFARNFAKGVHFSIDYKRLSHIGSLNQYPEQNSRQTAVAAGLQLGSTQSRYKGFFVLASNTSEQEDNGGILREPEIIPGRPSSPANAAVFLRNAQTRHSLRELSYTQHWRLGAAKDSAGQARRAFPIMHRIAWLSAQYKFFDRNPEGHQAFYALFPNLLADVRGTRYFIRHQKLENTLMLATQRTGRRSTDLLEAGLEHALHWIQVEPTDTFINSLFLTGHILLQPAKAIKLRGQAHLGILGNTGDYRIKADLTLQLPAVGELNAGFLSQLYSPTLQQHFFTLTQQSAWRNAFGKTLETALTAELRLRATPLKLQGGYYLLNNLVYFDTTATPRQTGIPVSILQLGAQWPLRLGKFGLDNAVIWQQSSEPVLRLPNLFSKHSLYFQGRWFRSLHVRLGLDFRLNTAWYADYYNPVVGQFILQNRQRVPFYPATDAFFSFRIATFRAYVKWEGLGAYLAPSPVYYQSAFYGHPFPGLRLGLKWKLAE